MYCEFKFDVSIQDPITRFSNYMQWIYIFEEGLMMIPSESKHVAQSAQG